MRGLTPIVEGVSSWIAAALLLPVSAFAQLVPTGAEFQVNSYTSAGQSLPDIGMDGEGDFVVVWGSFGQDGSYLGVFAQRFNSTGSPQAAEFQLNTRTTSFQSRPTVAMEGDGDFVVAWESYLQDGSAYGIFARGFDSTGGPQATEFQVNSYTASLQSYPTVALLSTGDFIVAWQSYQDGSYSGVFARRFGSTGVPLATEFQVNSYTASRQRAPAWAARATATSSSLGRA